MNHLRTFRFISWLFGGKLCHVVKTYWCLSNISFLFVYLLQERSWRGGLDTTHPGHTTNPDTQSVTPSASWSHTWWRPLDPVPCHIPLVCRSGFSGLRTASFITLLCCACAGLSEDCEWPGRADMYVDHPTFCFTSFKTTQRNLVLFLSFPNILFYLFHFLILRSIFVASLFTFYMSGSLLLLSAFSSHQLDYLHVCFVHTLLILLTPAEWIKCFQQVCLLVPESSTQPVSLSRTKPAPVGSFLLTFSTGTSRALLAHLHKFWMRLGGLRSPFQSPSHNPSGLS